VVSPTNPSIAPSSHLPLTKLLDLIADGQNGSLRQLYDRTGEQVYSLAVAIARDTHRAERITQQVYQDVWWRVADFDASLESVESWLSRLTRARLIDDLRRRRVEGQPPPHARAEPGSGIAVGWQQRTQSDANSIEGPVKEPASAA